MLTAIKGNIVHLPRLGGFEALEGGYIVLEEGVIQGVFPALPERFAAAEVEDYGEALIAQSFCDMHMHAPQYPMHGMGFDLPLLEWLEKYPFHTEARFADEAFARRTYRRLAAEFIAIGTTRVCLFSSLHRPATIILMEELERAGVTGLVGKVNMDRNGGAALEETTEESMRETLLWLEESARFKNIRPILTPRFVPSCTDQLMAFLGGLARERSLPAQSHLSENLAEIQWVKELHPDLEEYFDVYAKYGLFGPGTVMAHCVHSSGRELAAMREAGVTVAHCPDSNINICSGFPNVRTMLDMGVKVTLGSDVGGGALLPMNAVVTGAVRMSNAARINSRWTLPSLTFEEAAYLGTSAGAQYFGAGPGFREGDALHAIVIDDSSMPEPTRPLSLRERYERFMYLGGKGNIAACYSGGRKVSPAAE